MHTKNQNPVNSPRPATSSPTLALVLLVSTLCLTACGGGGGGGGNSNTAVDSAPIATDPLAPVAVPDNTFAVDCAGPNCGAINDSTYSGSGVGLWRYRNTTTAPALVPVALSGVLGRSVTLVTTSLADSGGLQGSPTSPQRFGSRYGDNHNHDPVDVDAPGKPDVNHVPDHIRHFTPPALERVEANGAARSLTAPAAPLASSMGDSRIWYSEDDSARLATLQLQRAASDGRVVNFWVENGEYGPDGVSPTQLESLANAFASGSSSVYASVVGLAGQPWGDHPYSNLIDPTQPLDVVLLNLTPDDQPFGLIGFFWGRNNFLRTTESFSNESLSFYLDTETLYFGGNIAFKLMISTLAHEFVHMINFYQRVVVRSTQTSDYGFDTWLEEMTALMMEDVVGLRLDAGFHIIRDNRFPTWLNGGDFNCDITLFDGDVDSPCFGYNVTGSFGAWLLRHYGIGFYQALLTNTSSTDSVVALDNAIRNVGGLGFKDAVRRWGTTLALLPAAGSPPWFGLPQRSEQGFTLPPIDGPAYLGVRQLPAVAPTALNAHGHDPQCGTLPHNATPCNAATSDTFTRTVTVPANTTLTVIVQ